MTSTNHVDAILSRGIPEISKDDLFSFHEAHFSQRAIYSFGTTFIRPANEVDDGGAIAHDPWEEEEDALGYYEDGVKRTLTDEQIEIFRHSELEALRKKQEKEANIRYSSSQHDALDASDTAPSPGGAASNASTMARVNKKKKKKKGVKRPQPEPKPDLRKRTWDVVEKGLDTLEYD